MFENHEHAIQLTSHGNYKGKSPASVFRRIKPSILKRIKKDSEYKSATKVLTSIENDQGGVMNARTGCDLPRNRQQVYNAKKTAKSTEESSDTFAEIMRLCKNRISTKDAFVRSVEAAPEPLCVLATKQQLVDMERFCTGENFSVLSADPTFNLGPFYVTPLMYNALTMRIPLVVRIHLFLDPYWFIRPRRSMRFTTSLQL